MTYVRKDARAKHRYNDIMLCVRARSQVRTCATRPARAGSQRTGPGPNRAGELQKQLFATVMRCCAIFFYLSSDERACACVGMYGMCVCVCVQYLRVQVWEYMCCTCVWVYDVYRACVCTSVQGIYAVYSVHVCVCVYLCVCECVCVCVCIRVSGRSYDIIINHVPSHAGHCRHEDLSVSLLESVEYGRKGRR